MVIHITKCVDFIFVRIGLQTQVVSMKDSAIQCTLLQAPPLSWNSITDTEEQELSDGMESDTGPDVDEDYSGMEDTSDLERYCIN